MTNNTSRFLSVSLLLPHPFLNDKVFTLLGNLESCLYILLRSCLFSYLPPELGKRNGHNLTKKCAGTGLRDLKRYYFVRSETIDLIVWPIDKTVDPRLITLTQDKIWRLLWGPVRVTAGSRIFIQCHCEPPGDRRTRQFLSDVILLISKVDWAG